MSNVVKVTPNEILLSVQRLKEISEETRAILVEFKKIRDKLDVAWSGSAQSQYNELALARMEEVKSFIEFCENYSDELYKTYQYYQMAEDAISGSITERVNFKGE